MAIPREGGNSVARKPAASTFWAFGLGEVATKAVGLLLQLYLGFLFLPEDFGVLAIFLSILAFVEALKAAGVPQELIRLRAGLSDNIFGEAYCLAWAVNWAIALVLVVLSQPIATLFQSQELRPLLLCLAITYPLGTIWSVCGPIIQTQISARRYVTIRMQGDMARLISTVLLLSIWPSPLAIALGFAVQATWLSVMGQRVSRSRLFPPRTPLSAMRQLWSRTRWLVFGTLAAALLQNGDYLTLGLVVPVATLGAYYFAFSLPAQAGLVAVALGDSMLLGLDRSRSQSRRGALLTATRRLVMVTGLLTWPLAVCLPSLEQVIWKGKWAFVVPASQVLCFFFPFRLTFIMQKIALVTTGNHRLWATLTAMQGLGMVATAAVVGTCTDALVVIAFAIGMWMALGTLLALLVAFRADDIGGGDLSHAVVRGLFIPFLSAAVGLATDVLVRLIFSAGRYPLRLAIVFSVMAACACVCVRAKDEELFKHVQLASEALVRRGAR